MTAIGEVNPNSLLPVRAHSSRSPFPTEWPLFCELQSLEIEACQPSQPLLARFPQQHRSKTYKTTSSISWSNLFIEELPELLWQPTSR